MIVEATIDINELPIPDEVIVRWQRIVNLMAKIIDVPAGLIMRVDPPGIEVFVSSETQNNPYEALQTNCFVEYQPGPYRDKKGCCHS